MSVPEADIRLGQLEVRNPKLKPATESNLIESKAWGAGETLGLSLFMGGVAYALVSVLTFVADLAYLGGGVGFTGGDSVPWQWYVGGSIAPAAAMSALVWYTQFFAPKRYPPLTFETREQKQAYLDYNELSRELQSDVHNAYTAYIESTPKDRHKAKLLWEDSLRTLKKREALREKQLKELEAAADVEAVSFHNPRLEEAAYDLDRLKDEVQLYE